jgi:Cys-rich protein (TIGR01571 family)
MPGSRCGHILCYACAVMGPMPLCCIHACLGARLRRRIRDKYGLPEEPCSDCCLHMWCSPSAMVQETIELDAREGILRGALANKDS